MAPDPIFSSIRVRPMAGYPYPARMRRFGPMAANGNIGAATRFPFFIDPYMSWARRYRSRHRVPCRPYLYVDLSRSRIDYSPRAYQHHNQQSESDNFPFHMLEFKLI